MQVNTGAWRLALICVIAWAGLVGCRGEDSVVTGDDKANTAERDADFAGVEILGDCGQLPEPYCGYWYVHDSYVHDEEDHIDERDRFAIFRKNGSPMLYVGNRLAKRWGKQRELQLIKVPKNSRNPQCLAMVLKPEDGHEHDFHHVKFLPDAEGEEKDIDVCFVENPDSKEPINCDCEDWAATPNARHRGRAHANPN